MHTGSNKHIKKYNIKCLLPRKSERIYGNECYKTIVMEKLAIVSGREGRCNKLDMPELRSWDL